MTRGRKSSLSDELRKLLGQSDELGIPYRFITDCFKLDENTVKNYIQNRRKLNKLVKSSEPKDLAACFTRLDTIKYNKENFRFLELLKTWILNKIIDSLSVSADSLDKLVKVTRQDQPYANLLLTLYPKPSIKQECLNLARMGAEAGESLPEIQQRILLFLAESLASGRYSYELSPGDVLTINTALNALNERSREIVKSIFGLDDQAQTYGQIAGTRKITRQRVGQIYDVALKQLRRIGALRHIPLTMQDRVQKLGNENDKLRDQLVSTERVIVPEKPSILDASIGELELSVRAVNCLNTAKVHTVRELIEKSPSDLLRIWSFGKKSLHEVEAMLNCHELKLRT